MKISIKNLQDTEELARIFAQKIGKTGAFLCMYGEIGTGKTTFTKFVAKHLGVRENVTSPSFVILNEYHSGVIPMYHFDLYRLETEGVKTITDELEEYSEDKAFTVVEWAEFSNVTLSSDRIELFIKYLDEEKREFEFKTSSGKYAELIKEVENEYTNL